MIKTIRLLCGFMAIAMMAFVASCSDDDVNTGGGGSVPVADGFYLSVAGGAPTEYQLLKAEVVENGFETQARDGYFANYMFLEAGEYNLVKVEDQEITGTYGGGDTPADSLREKSDCAEYNVYSLVNDLVEDGATFTVAASGLYYVGYDVSATEIFYDQIEVANIIGDATEAGWGHNAAQILPANGTISAAGASFKSTGQVLRPGGWKVRFNCRWKIDRRNSTADQLDPTLGYNALVNLGGEPSDLSTGGANFLVALGEDSENDIEVNWTPAGGWSLTVTKTADLDPITFVPGDFEWAITGAATSTGWPTDNTCGALDEDIDLNYEGVSGGVYSWMGTFALTADQFKFRKNDCWDGDKGYGGFATIGGPDAGLLTDVGGNFNATVAGNYTFIMSTDDDGATWSLNVDKE